MHTYDASADDFGLDAAQAAFKKRSQPSEAALSECSAGANEVKRKTSD